MTDLENKELQIDELEQVAGGEGLIDQGISTLEELENSNVFATLKSMLKMAKAITADKATLISTINSLAATAGITIDQDVLGEFVDKYYDLL